MASQYIAAAFNPAGTLFASVYQALDSHRLRITPLAAQTQSLVEEFQFDAKTRVTALIWLAAAPDAPSSKRRKTAEAASTEYVLLGTAAGQVLVFQPSLNKIVHTFVSGNAGVSALAAGRAGRCLVVHADSAATELDVSAMRASEQPPLPVTAPVSALVLPAALVVANTAPHLVVDGSIDTSYMGFAAPVRQLLALDSEHFAAISADRQVNIYARGDPSLHNALVCPNAAVTHISSAGTAALAATTEDGKVYVFTDVLTPQVAKKGRGFAHSTPQFSITVGTRRGALIVAGTRFADDFVVLAWPEQGVQSAFDRVQWRVDGVPVSEDVTLEKTALGPVAHESRVEGRDLAAAKRYTESLAAVGTGDQAAHLSDDETLADRLEALEKYEAEAGADADGEAPRARDLSQLAQAGSFATVLTQALKMNDPQLLEVCLEEQDEQMVRTSISRLSPKLAAALLEHLAATMARSPPRSAALMQWVRWTVVVHGGYLVTVPNLLKTLASLHSALTAKAATLPKLLALLGRLELLEEQLAVRSEQAEDMQSDEEPEVVFDESALIVNGEEADSASE